MNRPNPSDERLYNAIEKVMYIRRISYKNHLIHYFHRHLCQDLNRRMCYRLMYYRLTHCLTNYNRQQGRLFQESLIQERRKEVL